MLKLLAFFTLTLHVTFAVKGWDGIQSVSVDGFKCLKANGFDFFIGRVWTSSGNYDYTGMNNIKNAKAAGLYADAYIFPCLRSNCAGGRQQVEAAIDKMQSEGVPFGQVWLDIERYAWPSNRASNRKFVEDMVAGAQSRGATVGIYTNYYNWESIVGLSYTGQSDKQLWYAHYDGNPSFSDFQPFGGWSKPNIKQYKGTTAGPCGVSMDLDYYP